LDEFDELDEGADLAALTLRVASVNKEMRAATRKAVKEGGTAKPKSTLDAVMVLVKEQRKMNQVLTNMLDSFRSVVSCARHAFRQRFFANSFFFSRMVCHQWLSSARRSECVLCPACSWVVLWVRLVRGSSVCLGIFLDLGRCPFDQ
jgi:hypothetical protein